MSKKLILVGGGARSGKSAFALALGRQLGERRAFLATAQDLDAEMEARIASHRRERGDEFVTLEEPLDVPGAVARVRLADVLVIDCLTLWISNLLVRGDHAEDIAGEVRRLTEALAAQTFHAVLVTSEVGLGIVPESALGRAFRDAAGSAHQELASRAHRLYFAALGCVIRLKPAPLCLVDGPPGGEIAQESAR
ncbi:MAG TPA: bifunctional adenosylcobinamide kinase/adenosylcobinamide-phosphate guanylyltransferase [Anaeromyxobacteraceae bacterium]|nr:bifunctional adenosylcobinamide kinase/adenosylcobinamide-phosphate guanylyltransferase [Anaeromyxobacteraceae bacterium]